MSQWARQSARLKVEQSGKGEKIVMLVCPICNTDLSDCGDKPSHIANEHDWEDLIGEQSSPGQLGDHATEIDGQPMTAP